MQQYNQDEETEEYSAGKGTGEMPTKPNKRGIDRERKNSEEKEEYPAGKGTGEMPTKPNQRGGDREST